MITTVGLASKEMGRELKATELQRGAVVVIALPGRSILITMRVVSIDLIMHYVSFYSPVASWVVTVRYDQNAVMYDDKGRTVQVFEFLGEV